MKKVIYILIAILVFAWMVDYNHRTVQKQWVTWKIYGMAVRERAYDEGRVNGWNVEQTEKYINEQLSQKGIKRPNFCLYCWYKNKIDQQR
jgi:hypothetical protein